MIYNLFFLITLLKISSATITLCPTLEDYNIPNNTKCEESNIDDMNVTEIIQSWGFVAEEHTIQTLDGYNLLINRGYMPNTDGKEWRNVVILGHDVNLNALMFVARGNESIGYNFMQNGYDVWILNFRGTRYSKSNVNINITADSLEFWNFDYHDIAIMDVRQSVEFVYNTTQLQAVYVGYSTGSTVGVVYSIMFPEESQKYLKGAIYFSPVVYTKYIKSYGYKFLEQIETDTTQLLNKYFHGEFFPDLLNITRYRCTGESYKMYGCEIIWSVLYGFDFEGMDPRSNALLNGVLLDSTSWKLIVHYFQTYRSNIFSQFDYGAEENLEKYGQETPPVYNISQISIPVGVIGAANDFTSALLVKDVQYFYQQIPERLRRNFKIIAGSDFTHRDYIQVKNINEVFTKLLVQQVDDLIASLS